MCSLKVISTVCRGLVSLTMAKERKQRMQPSSHAELVASFAGSELGCNTTDTGKFSCILFFNRKGEGLSEEFS